MFSGWERLLTLQLTAFPHIPSAEDEINFDSERPLCSGVVIQKRTYDSTSQFNVSWSLSTPASTLILTKQASYTCFSLSLMLPMQSHNRLFTPFAKEMTRLFF